MAILGKRAKGNKAKKGASFRGSDHNSAWPSGCSYCKNVKGCPKGTWFNTHSSGQSVSGVERYCQKGLDASLRTSRVLFLGDSDMDLWPALRTNFVRSHNLGVGGYTCKDVYNEIKAGGKKNNMLKKTFGKPDTLVLVCGENDIANGYSVSKTVKTLEKIVYKARTFGKVKRVIYLGTKPEPSTTHLHSKYRQYDAMVKQLALEYGNAERAAGEPVSFIMIDVYSAFEALGNPNSLYHSDGLHLSSQGYDLWTNWTQTALADTAGDCLVPQGSTCNERRLLDVMV